MYQWFRRMHAKWRGWKSTPALLFAARLITIAAMLFGWFWLSLPDPLFRHNYSTVVTGHDGSLLSARVADDEQWRFPVADSLPYKYVVALLVSEDRNFLMHHGVYYPSLLRAAWENMQAGRIVRGGSTITMQVVRLSRGNPPRTLPQKFVEVLLAWRLELTTSKVDILRLYAAHAPFGSNVVGLEAASWRYFGKPPSNLTWAESAMLAVLPNNPGRIYPGRNSELLKQRRDHLLRQLAAFGFFCDETLVLSMYEPIPDGPGPIPDLAPHLLDRLVAEGGKGTRLHTTVSSSLQQRVDGVMQRHHRMLSATGIHNMAVMVMETRSGKVRVYQGNVVGSDHNAAVDVIRARRSSGSILKPFLYAMMLDDGIILPGMLVRDIPLQVGNFRPENYSRQYSGAVPARMALSRSLNIPAVRLLHEYGVARFCDRMRLLGKSTLEQPASHYGLSVILGGAESRLWDLCGMYASMGRTLYRFNSTNGKYGRGDFHPPVVLECVWEEQYSGDRALRQNPEVLHAGSVWKTFEAMIEVVRPEEDAHWRYFTSSPGIAWKTGTSYGNRDAWAIGVTPDWVVGVWVGNATGEGRPSLTGTASAAPVLFDVFGRLPTGAWFEPPLDNLQRLVVCRHSGHPLSDQCAHADTIYTTHVDVRVKPCPYHQIVHLDSEEKFRVNSGCYDPSDMIRQQWFVLPPAMEYYYAQQNPTYRSLPPWHPDCRNADGNHSAVMDVIYPVNLGEIMVPVDLSGARERVVFEVAHSAPDATLYWFLNDEYIGSTQRVHKMSLDPPQGEHLLTLNDEMGNRVSRRFRIVTTHRR